MYLNDKMIDVNKIGVDYVKLREVNGVSLLRINLEANLSDKVSEILIDFVGDCSGSNLDPSVECDVESADFLEVYYPEGFLFLEVNDKYYEFDEITNYLDLEEILELTDELEGFSHYTHKW